MPVPVILGADDQTVYIKIVDSTDFSPETGVTSASAGLALWYRKGPTGAVTAITESDLAAVDSAHSDGGMKHLSDGVYRLDLPDAAIPTIENEITVVDGTVTSMQVLGCSLVGVQPIGAPAGASVSADIAAIEAQTDDIGIAGAGLTAVPWNAAWDAEVESEVDDAIGGGTGTALTAIPWNASWDAEVQSEAADALTAYAPATVGAAMTLASGAITAAVVATGAIDADALAADAGTELGTAVWASATRTLTQSAASVTATVDGSTITDQRGDTWSISFTGLGTVTGYENSWFTIKDAFDDTDAQSIIQIDTDTGLLYVNGATASAASGSIAWTNETTGACTVTVAATVTDDIAPGSYEYDMQWQAAGGAIHTLTTGRFVVARDVTRAVS